MAPHTDMQIVVDNEATYDICGSLGVTHPSYVHINRLIAQMASSLTVSLRFDGNINVELNDFQTNLVPYPRIHYLLSSYAPLVSAARACHEVLNVSALANAVLDPSSLMTKCDMRCSQYIAVSGTIVPS